MHKVPAWEEWILLQIKGPMVLHNKIVLMPSFASGVQKRNALSLVRLRYS